MSRLVGVSISRGISQRTGVPAHYLPEAYINALHDCGVVPIMIPSTLDEDGLRAIYERVDGIMLSGGGDFHPQRSGIPHDDRVEGVDEPRDATEISLTQWAFEDDKPLFGICRGHQAMNIAMGGTLVMDIPSTIQTQIIHQISSRTEDRAKILHTVEVDGNSTLAQVFRTSEVPVNSIHHQAVDRLGRDLCAIAYAPDGIIEAIEVPSARYFVGVQWHPEEIYHFPQMRALFRSFTEALQ